MNLPKKIAFSVRIQDRQIIGSRVNVLEHAWYDIGRRVGCFMVEQRKYRRQVNNPDGSFDCSCSITQQGGKCRWA